MLGSASTRGACYRLLAWRELSGFLRDKSLCVLSCSNVNCTSWQDVNARLRPFARPQVYIKDEGKHRERMQVRAKYMALDRSNRYMRHMRSIRLIQDYLVRSADKVAMPKFSNSNVDASVSAIHASVLAALGRCVAEIPCRSISALACSERSWSGLVRADDPRSAAACRSRQRRG